jgi:hypothetical protein
VITTLNELITLTKKNLRNNHTQNSDDYTKEIKQSFEKLTDTIRNSDNWLRLIKIIQNESFTDNCNYLSLIEESRFFEQIKIIENPTKEMLAQSEEFFTQWIHKFKADANEAVIKLIETYNQTQSNNSERVPSKYLKENVHQYNSQEIKLIKPDVIKVGEYCNHGVIIPRNFGSIIFNQLYNCTPLISLIKGEQEFISFLHTWAEYNENVVDKQVKYWMQNISELGDVVETIFAPRNNATGSDTRYLYAPDYLRTHSKKTIILNRDLDELTGIVNKDGIYFEGCGYHLWES